MILKDKKRKQADLNKAFFINYISYVDEMKH